ncbi:MAG: T9SS type A sorting domain-containing protein [Bacteroidetes bacterium]|nr:T9SS type A sorting domain-containing protein [Bacteroidota bacterium]
MTAIAILGLATLSMAQVPYYVPTNGLVGWWPFNGNANDESGNGNNGTTTGTFANDRYNSPNSAIALSGSQQLITIPGANSFDTDTFTLSFWTLANNYNIHNKIQYGVIGNSLRFSVNWSLTGLSYSPMTCAGTYAASGNGTSLSGVNLNIWHHITYVVQGTTTSFYINGFLIDVQNSASPLTCFSSIMNLYFGGDIGGGIIEYYSGLFDDIGFWTIALTSQEIANLFNGCIASVNSQPTNQTININNIAQFVVNSSDPSATYQWQTDLGVGFQNLNSVGQYSGTTNDTLTVSNVTMSNNNQPFRCIVSSGSCSDTSNVAVLTVNNNVGINETIQDKLFSVFPNPARSIINVKADGKLIGSVYSIYDNTGRVVLTGKLNSENSTIELCNLSGGIYMFSVGENMKQTFKVIKE